MRVSARLDLRPPPSRGRIRTTQALANIEGETRELVHAGEASTPKSETAVEIAPLVQKVGAISIAEIEKLIGELQEAKDFLQSEGERVQRETERYTNFTQMASASVKIISDTVAGWREAGHPSRNLLRTSQLEVTHPSLSPRCTSMMCQNCAGT